MDLIGIEPMTSSMPFGLKNQGHTGEFRGTKRHVKSTALKKKCPSCALDFDLSFPGRGRKRCWGQAKTLTALRPDWHLF